MGVNDKRIECKTCGQWHSARVAERELIIKFILDEAKALNMSHEKIAEAIASMAHE